MHLPQHRKSFMQNKTAINQSIFIYSRIKKCKILKFNNNTVWIKADQIRDINVACCEEFQCRYTCFGLEGGEGKKIEKLSTVYNPKNLDCNLRFLTSTVQLFVFCSRTSNTTSFDFSNSQNCCFSWHNEAISL